MNRIIWRLLLILSAIQLTDGYIKGSMDVARCRASCSEQFLPHILTSDASCDSSPDCNMCWETCGYLFENYFLWVDMCGNMVICMAGCLQACTFWDSAESPGYPLQNEMSIDVYTVGSSVVFQWQRSLSADFNTVYVLRKFNEEREEWVTMAQTLDNSCMVRRHYLTADGRFQLAAVAPTRILAIADVEVDLTPETSLNGTDHSNLTQMATLHLSDRERVSPITSTIYGVLACACAACCLVIIAIVVRSYRQKKKRLSRLGSIRSHTNVVRHSSTCSTLTIDPARVAKFDVATKYSAGYTVCKGFYASLPVYVLSCEGEEVGQHARHHLMIQSSRLAHLGKHSNFLSGMGIVQQTSLTMLLVERELQFTTLSLYLRTCYNEGEIIGDTLHAWIPIGMGKEKTTLSSDDMTLILLTLASTMQYLSERDFVHKHLSGDVVIIDPSSKKVKLVDYELAQSCLGIVSALSLTHFTAPESQGSQPDSSTSDVWSYGMLMWQAVQFGTQPMAELEDYELYSWLCSGNRPRRPVNISKPMFDVMMSCWELLPEQRPSFSDLTELLLIMFDDSECHVSVVCRDSDQQTFAVEIVDLLPTSVKAGHRPLGREISLNCSQSIGSRPTAAIARSMLTSSCRLNAVSDCRVESGSYEQTDNYSEFDPVFSEEELEYDDETSILSSVHGSPAAGRARKYSIGLRKGSVKSLKGKVKKVFSNPLE